MSNTKMLGNPLEVPNTTIFNCNNPCPKYNDQMKDFIIPVKRGGISQFLSNTCIDKQAGWITPNLLINTLSGSHVVGKIVRSWQRSTKFPPLNVPVTALQLFTSSLIWVEINKHRNCYCWLNTNDFRLVYFDSGVWDNIRKIKAELL